MRLMAIQLLLFLLFPMHANAQTQGQPQQLHVFAAGLGLIHNFSEVACPKPMQGGIGMTLLFEGKTFFEQAQGLLLRRSWLGSFLAGNVSGRLESIK